MTNNCYPTTENVQYADDTLIFEAYKNPSTAGEAIETQIECLCSYFEKKTASECIEYRIRNIQQTSQTRKL